MTNEINDDKPAMELSEFEQECVAAGWDPNGKKPAGKWALDGLDVRNQKITDLYKISHDLKDMMTKQEKAIHDKVAAELRAERDEAIRRGDVNHVREIEMQQEAAKSQNEIQQQAQAFIQRNADWYNGSSYEHLKMQKAAKEADGLIGGDDPADHFRKVEEYIKGEFPDYFNKDEPKKRGQAVEGGKSAVVRTSSSKRDYSFDDLSDDQKTFAKMYEKRGIMTIDKYIEEQIKAGYLK
jgi:hypothetical protein